MAKLGDLVAVISADTKQFNKAIGQVQNRTKRAVGNIGNLGRQMSMSFTAPLALIAGQSMKTFMSFEQQMAKVKAVSGATADEFAKLEANAKELGATTRFSASEVAQLQTEFAKLGFTADEITKVTGATLALAQATDSDLARAAEVAGSTLRGFGMEADETSRVTDVMAASFSNTALDMESFAESMKYVAPVANAAGLSIEETTAMLGTLANAGIKGSQAGTALRRIISELGATGGDVSAQLKDLAGANINLADAKDEVGRSAQSALLVLSKGTGTTDELTSALNNSAGAAKAMADTMDDTAAGAMARMRSALEAAQIEIGQALAPAVTSLMNGIASLASKMSEMSDTTQKIVVVIGGVVAAIGPAIVVLAQMAKSFMLVRTVIMRGVIPAMQKMLAYMVANPILLVTTAVAGLVYVMKDYINVTDSATKAQESFADSTTKANVLAAKNGAEVSRLADIVRDETIAEEERIAALKQMQQISPQHFKNLSIEQANTSALTDAVDAYRESLLRAAKTKVYTAKLEELVARQEELKAEFKEGPSYLDRLAGAFMTVGSSAGQYVAMNERLGTKAKAVTQEIAMLQDALMELAPPTQQNTEQSEKMAVGYEEVAQKASRARDELEKLQSVAPSEVQTTTPSAPDQLAKQDFPLPTADEFKENFIAMEEARIRMEKMQKLMESLQGSADQLGSAFGAAFGQIIKGEGEVGESMKGLAKSVVGTMLNIAKSSIIASATQSAAASGPGAIAVAPVLIGAGLSLVEGLFNAIAFADGGIVSGPTLGLVGEYAGARNNPEVIAPLDKLQSMIDNSSSNAPMVLTTKLRGGDIEIAAQTGRRKLRRTR